MPIKVWAASTAAPGNVCADARLLGEGRELEYPKGLKPGEEFKDRGQAGWDVGVGFTDFFQLADHLSAIKRAKGPIERLGINLHGGPGVIDADGKGEHDLQSLTEPADGYPTTVLHYNIPRLRQKYSSQLKVINTTLTAGAMVIFEGCMVAAGSYGDKFLCDISSEFFPGKNVVAFKTIQFFSKSQMRAGQFCSNPGNLDSAYDRPSPEGTGEEARRWRDDLYVNPEWANENSPSAKWGKDGKLVKGADPKIEDDRSAQAFLPGSWSVQIGSWNGTFVFRKDKTCFWVNADNTGNHKGKWWEAGNEVVWTYEDETKGWERLFHAAIPLQSAAQGSFTVNGRQSGMFSMNKW